VSKKTNDSGLPVLLGVTTLAYYFFLRPQMQKWGTRLGESQRLLPGDEIIPKPNFQMTHAINIDAPPEALWPWLAQMGREQSGYYGLDIFENQGIPSVNFIRQDITAPEVDMELDGGFHIIELETNRKFLFGAFNLQKFTGAAQDVTILYLLERRPDGSTRLLVRRRAFSYGLSGALHNFFDEITYYISAKRQFTKLKQYAESMAYLQSAAAQP
jgi:hypothetical protein